MIENMVELVGIELTMSLENRQVIEFAQIAQCPECLKILAIPNSLYVYCTVIFRKINLILWFKPAVARRFLWSFVKICTISRSHSL